MGAREEDDGAEVTPADTRFTPGSSDVGRDGIEYTPLFKAQHEARYARQELIRRYEFQHDCNFVVLIDQISTESVTYFAELLHGVKDPSKDLHLLLCSPGGDGETAIRLARMGQTASERLVVVVPEMAKSAATILALGADAILMGPTSDLGPIDPQILLADRGFVSAKDLIAAVDRAMVEVQANPGTYPLHSAMLGGIDATSVQFARSALARTEDLARQAISSNPHRDDADVARLLQQIRDPLITAPNSHGALIGLTEARSAGLPVTELDPSSAHWNLLWALWTRYFALSLIHI